jgi:hypothetical protein
MFDRADQSITLSTPTGTLRLANTRSGGNQGAALIAPANLKDDQWTSAVITREAVDVAAVIIPLNDQFTATISYVEGKSDAAAAAALAGNAITDIAEQRAIATDSGSTLTEKKAALALIKQFITDGLGGASGHAVPGSTSVAGSLKYAAGPLTVTAGYTSTTFTQNTLAMLVVKADPTGTAGVTTGDIQTTSYDISAIFDAGVAKFGVGYDSSRRGYTSADKSALLVGVSVPLGAVTLGGNYGSRDAANFLQLAAQYDLSKRTNVNFSWGQDKQGAGKDTTSQYRLSLNHAF